MEGTIWISFNNILFLYLQITFLIRQFTQAGLHRQSILDPIRVFTIMCYSYIQPFRLQMLSFRIVVSSLDE